MSALRSRKNLLIAESELNRAHLAQAWQAMAGEVYSLTGQVGRIGAFASVAATLVAILAFFRRKKPVPAVVAGKPSWWRTAFKNARMVFTLWKIFRPPGRGQGDK
jgi:hypothetical protein